MPKVQNWIGLIFFAFGMVFAGVGSWFYISDLGLATTGVSTVGTVIDLEARYDSDSGTTYRPVVEYRLPSGQPYRFTASVGSSPAAYDRGETVYVIYDPEAPSNALVDSFTERLLFPLAFGGFGLVFGGIGAGLLIGGFLRRRQIERLKQSGIPIEAKFVDCYRDTSTEVNGRSPFRVAAQATHPITGKLTSFESEFIWLDLSDVLKGKSVGVLVDAANPKLHNVDLSEYVDEDD